VTLRFRGVLATTVAVGLLTAVVLPTGPALADGVRDGQWHLKSLDVAAAHKLTKGRGVIVAVIDSGVDATQPDLKGAVLPGADFSSGSSSGDGRKDLTGHGTAMAGLIAGRGHGDGDGVLGIAPEANILPIRTSTKAYGDGSELISALDFAVSHGADVINMSFGDADDSARHEAIRKASAAGAVLVGAMGNRNDGADQYPASYQEVIGVGALDRTGTIRASSVSGSGLDIVAPGQDLPKITIDGSGYSIASGTSDATAIVSGAVALVRARYPDAGPADVMKRLTETATDKGAPGRDDTYGYGSLDVVKALTADVAPADKKATAVSSASAEAFTPGDTELSPLTTWFPIILIGAGVIVVLVVVGVVVMVVRRRS
jgi:type VII secretion-associated serine protease mycosin